MTAPISRPIRTVTALLLALSLFAFAFAQDGAAAEGQGAPEAQPASEADPVVIQVGSVVERLSDFDWRFGVVVRNVVAQQGMPYSPEVAQQLRPLAPTYLQQRAEELALVVEARRRGLEPDAEGIARDLEELRASAETEEEYTELLASAGFSSEEQIIQILEEASVVNQLIGQLMESAEAGVTDAALRSRYLAERDRFRSPESFCARHILVADVELAEEILAQLAAGDEFADLAAEHGTDGTSTRGGDLGCFGRGAMVADFEQAVLEAEVGVPSGPVETQFGYHVLLVYDHTPARTPAFEEVEEQVRDLAVGYAAEAAIDGIIEGSGLITYPERLEAQ